MYHSIIRVLAIVAMIVGLYFSDQAFKDYNIESHAAWYAVCVLWFLLTISITGANEK